MQNTLPVILIQRRRTETRLTRNLSISSNTPAHRGVIHNEHPLLPLRPVHVKRPKNVSNGLFNAGLGIVLIALAESRTSPRYQQLQASSGVDRGRAAIGSVTKWAMEMCRRPNKREFTLELLRKAGKASSATKASLLKRFGLVRNPVSICRELGIVVKALVRALADAEVVGDHSNETRAATAGIFPPASERSSLSAGEALMPRQEEKSQILPTVNSGQQAQETMVLGTATITRISAVTECSVVGACEGVTARGVIGVTATQADGDVAVAGGVDSVDKIMQDETATPGKKGVAVHVAADLGSRPHCGADGRRSLRPTQEKDPLRGHVRATHPVSHKNARPSALEWRVGCGGWGGGRGGGEVNIKLNQAIKGRAMALLLLNRERQQRKHDADRHKVELEKVRLDAIEGARLARGFPHASATNVCMYVVAGVQCTVYSVQPR